MEYSKPSIEEHKTSNLPFKYMPPQSRGIVTSGKFTFVTVDDGGELPVETGRFPNTYTLNGKRIRCVEIISTEGPTITCLQILDQNGHYYVPVDSEEARVNITHIPPEH